MSRADNLKFADPATFEARKADALALLAQGKTYKEIIAEVRAKHGMGIGFSVLTREAARLRRLAKREARKNGAPVKPPPKRTNGKTPAGLTVDAEVELIARFCRSGLRCVLKTDGSIEVLA